MRGAKRPAVLVGIPTYKHVPSLSYIAGISTIVDAGMSGILATVSGKIDMYITMARNELCEYAIEMKRKKLATHLFQMDDDMVIPNGTIQQLLEREVGVVGGAYWGKNLRPIAYNLLPPGSGAALNWWSVIPRAGLRKADGLGAGCLLTEIGVLEQMHNRYGDKRWFQNADSDQYLGEDVFFFRRLKEMGIPAYIDCDAVCGHIAPVVVDRGLVEANIRNSIENVVLARQQHFEKIRAAAIKKGVKCKEGCSHCCKKQSFTVDIIDGIVALWHLQQQKRWTPAMRRRLLASDRGDGICCPFLERDSCSLYPNWPACCAVYFGFNPPRCANEGTLMTSNDPQHATMAKTLIDQLNPPMGLYKLSGAVLTASAMLEGETLPQVWKVKQ